MGTASVMNIYLKIGNLSSITENELKNAVESFNIDPQYYIYKILFQIYPNLINKNLQVSNEDRMNYYRNIVIKFINLYPDIYSLDDIELYSKFALSVYLYNINGFVEIDFIEEILNILSKDNINFYSLKWCIKETLKNYILRYYMMHENYYHLMRPLIDDLLINEKAFYELLIELS